MGGSYSASVLAGLLMMFVFVLMIFERVNKNSKKYSFSTHDTSKFTQKRELGKIGSAAAFLWCASVFCLAFVFPFTWLLYWSIHDSFKFEFVQMALNSLLMAADAAILITAVSFFLFLRRGL